MNTELQAKFLQHIIKTKKNSNEGFTLIELLVVIVIIGILAAVALPSFLSQADKARESGAKTVIGSINRAQQAHRVEYTTFATSYTDLKISDPAAKDYTIGPPKANAASAESKATATDSSLKDFTGKVTYSGGVTTSTIIEE